MANYRFEKDTFVIEQYDQAKTFSSFLPGIAGLKGIPMWTFYVNRGQGICSFGIRDKNSPIMEFSPANIAYKNVSATGFRTFIKLAGTPSVYEPFQSFQPDPQAQRTMFIRQNELVIEEDHAGNGLRTSVSYFQLPGEDFAALAREVKITNAGTRNVSFELLDGLPEILPYGVANSGYKEIGNLLRSWMEVENLDQGIPFYKVRSSTHDEAEVSEVTNGHFYLSFDQHGKLIKPLVDFELIFGGNTSLIYPDRFATASIESLAQTIPYAVNKVPCGFSGLPAELGPGESITVYTLVGHVNDITRINKRSNDLSSPAYILSKRMEAAALTRELTDDVATNTGLPIFDEYSRQSYLDNFLRGGYPFIFDNGKEGAVVHLYSRKHGDLERDYNFFSLAPEYYSQGNGNFRDMNQNRRNDVFFNPKVGTFNIRMFFSLIQADGYNPLSVEGTKFRVTEGMEEQLEKLLRASVSGDGDYDKLKAVCGGDYTPGNIINAIADQGIELSIGEEPFLSKLLTISDQHFAASFGEGFWSDHWTYNMDLVDAYLNIYPDRCEELLFGEKTYSFFDSPVYVLPRHEKVVISRGKVRQYGALLEDEEKLMKLGRKRNAAEWLRVDGGKGSIYRTHLFVKMISLSLSKMATLDPYGMGVEMEANKPGWNDAMNGLPGLFGSGMSETMELKRMAAFIVDAAEQFSRHTIQVPEEIASYLEGVFAAVQQYHSGALDSFRYWDQVAGLRESYRASVRFGITGREVELPMKDVKIIYAAFLSKINEGIERAEQMGGGIVPTYFRFEVEQFEEIRDAEGNPVITGYGLPAAKVLGFKPYALPHFLEAPARGMKLAGEEQARAMYERIKASELYDPELGMYKTSVSLEEESDEIGRIRAFTAGWLERESVFLHMTYKYLLSLLKAGLYDEFFSEIRLSFIPFLDPAVYGRSTLENSSFIASSVNPDPHVHGRGFVARLSGSTAEFLSMWITMMAGKQVFRYEDHQLQLHLNPVLPAWLFDENHEVSFTLLGSVKITYRSKRTANTYGQDGVRIQRLTLTTVDGDQVEVDGPILSGKWAHEVRNGNVQSIQADMG
ncbi:cellobiose phosphorylase [Paenibacillus glucanolyticus]|uniref:cellobiose phosphorylase n=1 Tax=Paenibacillus glucanolyticus TaxID=59843 RepID=UPI0036B50649